jgi:hypothetical protein
VKTGESAPVQVSECCFVTGENKKLTAIQGLEEDLKSTRCLGFGGPKVGKEDESNWFWLMS